MTLTEQIRNKALALEFDLAGVVPAFPVPHLDHYHDWLAQGYHGEMGYMARPDRVERRENPSTMLPDARSVVCVGLNYYPGPLPDELGNDPSHGLIARYAWGTDYHDLMLARLKELAAFIHTETGGSAATRTYVDTGPILERAYAAAAGLGFIGKNTCLIHPQMGTWLFLGEILVDVELKPTPSKMKVSCGTCRRCLDACPTGALVAPYTLDARRCISYLTIELKGSIPHELRPLMGNWIYGCDVCQLVCPWQRFAKPTQERAFLAANSNCAAPPLVELAEMDEEAFRQRYEGTPIARIGRRRLLRNVAVALGNWRSEDAIEPLTRLASDPETLVRAHAAWALARIGSQAAQEALKNVPERKEDPCVWDEISRKL
jgi:epoxyqueuosine reductase